MDSRKILAHLRASTCKVRGRLPTLRCETQNLPWGAGETGSLFPLFIVQSVGEWVTDTFSAFLTILNSSLTP